MPDRQPNSQPAPDRSGSSATTPDEGEAVVGIGEYTFDTTLRMTLPGDLSEYLRPRRGRQPEDDPNNGNA